jgi:hypothetical protein
MVRRVALFAVSVAIFLATAEVLGLAVFYWDTGNLYYLYRRPVDPIFEAADTRLTGEALHPYFGITHKAGYPFDIPEALRPERPRPPMATNNYGFVATSDYPVARTSDRQFVIGIFGGSVGVWFCGVGVPTLLDELAQHPFFRDRELVPLCFSHEGYKQPQQLQVLSYFLSLGQPFDLVINIDGFNEVALSSINDERGIDIAMPSTQHLEPLVNLVNRFTLTPEKLQSLAAIGRDRATLARIDGWRTGSNREPALSRFARHSAALYIVLERYAGFVRARYERERVAFDQLPSNPSGNSIIEVVPRTEDVSAALFDRVARNWAQASVLMRDMLAAKNIPYVHVLQPNQYFTTRRFGEDESRVAINPASPFKQGAEAGYPALVTGPGPALLKDQGVRFLDGTRIFDAESAPVYIDDCCHYTRRGYELLARFLANAILQPDGLSIRGATGAAGR